MTRQPLSKDESDDLAYGRMQWYADEYQGHCNDCK